ncbi:MAG: hypothetical protein Q4C47_06510, partial [Planctomycetia bacterium]|nr:hypothetical protein [Planctomycetia bacterium]
KQLYVQTGELFRRGRTTMTGALRERLATRDPSPRKGPFRSAFRQAALPLIVTAALWPVWARSEQADEKRLLYGAVTFLITVIVLNSRPWRLTEEFLIDQCGLIWRAYGLRFILLGCSWIADLFRTGMAAIERSLYVVDERLRIPRDQSGIGTVLRVIVLTLWGAVAYFIRFAVSLFIEPQINPLKHFPVVTVSHKFLLPTIPFVGSVLTPMVGSQAEAIMIATVIITSIPGMFGFLVWELKEGWRLYAANRSTDLKPVSVGAHGETVAGLLRRGFHSGTIPRTFRRLRKAEQTLRRTGDRTPLRRQLQALEHVEQRLRTFFCREMAVLLRDENIYQMTKSETPAESDRPADRNDTIGAENTGILRKTTVHETNAGTDRVRETNGTGENGDLTEYEVIRIGKISLKPTLVTVEWLWRAPRKKTVRRNRGDGTDEVSGNRTTSARTEEISLMKTENDDETVEFRPLLTLRFEMRQRFLLADLTAAPECDTPDPGMNSRERHGTLAGLPTALCGLYRMAGVELVGEQIRGAIETRETWYLEEKRLVVQRPPDQGETDPVRTMGDETGGERPDRTFRNLRVYRLDSPTEAILPGEYTSPDIPVRGPALRRSELIFAETPLPWTLWTRCWGDPDELHARRRLAAAFDFDPCEFSGEPEEIP